MGFLKSIKKALFGKKEEANWDASNAAMDAQNQAIGDYAGFQPPREAYTTEGIKRGVLDVTRTQVGNQAKAARSNFLNRFGSRLGKSGTAIAAASELEENVAGSALDRILGAKVELANQDLALQREYAGTRMNQLSNVASMRGNYAGAVTSRDMADFQTRKAGEDKGLLSTFIAPLAGKVAGAWLGKKYFDDAAESGKNTSARRILVGENLKGSDRGRQNPEVVSNPTGAPLVIKPVRGKALDRFRKSAKRRAA